MKDKVASTLEADGYAETTSIFPSTFDDEDVATLLDNLGVEGLITDGSTLILSSFLAKCTKKLRERFVQVLEEADNPSTGKPDKKKKKKDDGSMPLSQADVMKFLEEKKMMEYIIDEDQREAFFRHLKPLLDESYKAIKEELNNQKIAASGDIVVDLTTKIEHIELALLIANKTIKSNLELNPGFEASSAEHLAISPLRPLVERIILLNLKKYKIHVDPSHLKPRNMEEGEQTHFDRMTTPLFVDGVNYEGLIDKLHKEYRESLKELVLVAALKNLPKLCVFLEENAEAIGAPKANLNKKTEKSFFLAQKYYAQEKMDLEEDVAKLVCLIFSEYLMSEGQFLWPIDPSKPGKDSLKTLWTSILALKIKGEVKHLDLLQQLYDLGMKESSRVDLAEAKKLAKGLGKLI